MTITSRTAASTELPTAAALMKIFDAVYDVEQPRDAWLNGVLAAMAPALGRGAGIGGLLYDISVDSPALVEVMRGVDVASDWMQAGLVVHQDSRFIPQIVACYRSILCATFPELIGDPRILGELRTDYHDPHDVGGQILINGGDCSGKGCAFYVFSRGSVAISDGQRDLFSRLATHISTAYRLQRQLTSEGARTFKGVEAVLTPAGQLEHAEASVKSPAGCRDLKLAVRQRERARDGTNHDAERVVKSLKGLVSARWTLVDHYESGKRHVLARENAPKPLCPPHLSPREQQVVALATLGRSNKLIAYELGLAYSTVRVLMARACLKIGVKTRTELITRQ